MKTTAEQRMVVRERERKITVGRSSVYMDILDDLDLTLNVIDDLREEIRKMEEYNPNYAGGEYEN